MVLLIQYVQICRVFLSRDPVCILVSLLPFRHKIKELLYRHTIQLMVIQRIHQMEEGKEGLFIILHKLMFICSLSGIISVSFFIVFCLYLVCKNEHLLKQIMKEREHRQKRNNVRFFAIPLTIDGTSNFFNSASDNTFYNQKQCYICQQGIPSSNLSTHYSCR